MLPRKLKQLLRLSGGKVIINDEQANKAFVVMGLKEYLREIRRMGELEPEEFWGKYDFDEWELEDDYYLPQEDEGFSELEFSSWEADAKDPFSSEEMEDDNYFQSITSFQDPEQRLDNLPKRNFQNQSPQGEAAANLTNTQLLDRINADIDQLRQRRVEEELENSLEAEQSEIRYEEL
jgi:hypothetical protein